MVKVTANRANAAESARRGDLAVSNQLERASIEPSMCAGREVADAAIDRVAMRSGRQTHRVTSLATAAPSPGRA